MLRVLVVVAGVLGLTAPAVAQEVGRDYSGYLDRVLTEVLRPSFVELERNTAALDESLVALCADRSAESLDATREAFAAVTLNWGRVTALQIDPLLAESQRERFYFWPDPRGVTLRQIQPVLIEEDESVTTADSLRDKSVALQGLGALEYLLHGTGNEALADASAPDHRCRYAVAVGALLTELAAAFSEAIAPDGPFSQLLSEPGPDNPLYQTPQQAAADFVLSAVSGIDLSRDALVIPVLGDSPDLARPRTAPLWRAGLSLEFLGSLLAGSEALLIGVDLESLLPASQRWILESLTLEFGAIHAAIPDAAMSIEAAVSEQRQSLELVTLIGANLKALTGTYLSQSLGLSLGFNALDGD